MAGVDIYRVMAFMGHADVKTTMRYAHLAPTALDGLAEVLDGPRGAPLGKQEVAVMRGLLLGMAMVFAGGSAWAGSLEEEQRFILVDLTCPQGETGVLEVTRANQRGETALLLAEVHGGIIDTVTVEVARRGEKLEVANRIDLRSEKDPDTRSLGNSLAQRAAALVGDVCLASEATRKAYFDTLKANRKALGLP